MEGLFFEYQQLKNNLKINKKALRKAIEQRFPMVFAVSGEIFYDLNEAVEYSKVVPGEIKEIKTSKVQLKLLLVRLPVKQKTTVQIGSIRADSGSVISFHGNATVFHSK